MIRGYKIEKNIRGKKIRQLKRHLNNLRKESKDILKNILEKRFDGTINYLNHYHIDWYGFGNKKLNIRKRYWEEYCFILFELNKFDLSNVQVFVLIDEATKSNHGDPYGSADDALYAFNDPIMKYDCVKSKHENYFKEAFEKYNIKHSQFNIGFCEKINHHVIQIIGNSKSCFG
jgi:hypothetical protein